MINKASRPMKYGSDRWVVAAAIHSVASANCLFSQRGQIIAATARGGCANSPQSSGTGGRRQRGFLN
jgi:hypothetical protein